MRSSAVYVVGTIVQRGLGILLLPVTTRILGVEQYGLAGTASALTALLAIVFGLGLNFSIVRFYYDNPPDDRRTKWSALLQMQAAAAAVLTVLTYLTGPYWSRLLGDVGWVPAVQIAVLAAWVGAVQSTIASVVRAQQRAGAFLVMLLVQLLLGSALGVALATRWDAAGYMGGLGLGSVAAMLVGLTFTNREPAWDRSLPLAGLRLSLPSWWHQLAVWGTNLSDRLIIAGVLGTSAVARYTIPYTAGTILILLLTSVQQAWAPTYMGQGEEARLRLPGRLILPVTAALALAVALLILVAPLIVDLLAPERFRVQTLLIAVIAVATLPRAAYLMAVVALVDRKKTGRMATASGLGAAFNVTANLIAIPIWGIGAAAVTTVVAEIIMAVLVITQAGRLLGTSLRLGRLIAVWVAGASLSIVLSTIPEVWAWAPVRVGLAAVIAAGMVLAARAAREAFRAETEGRATRVEEQARAAAQLA